MPDLLHAMQPWKWQGGKDRIGMLEYQQRQRKQEQMQAQQQQQAQTDNLTAGAASLAQQEPFSPLADPAARFGEQVGLLSQGGPQGQAQAGALMDQARMQRYAASPAGQEQARQAEELRQLDLQEKMLANVKTARELRQMDADYQKSLKAPVMSGEEIMDILSMTEALNSVDQLSWLVGQLGAVTSPVEFLANPAAAAAMDQLESFDMVNIFKTLANDSRLSNEDRDFYQGLAKPGFFKNMIGGGEYRQGQLSEIQRRLERIWLLNSARPGVPELALRRRQFGQDIGQPVTRQQLPTETVGLTERDRMLIREDMMR